MIKAIVTDIEGTTTQLSFVKDVLFPYAQQHLPNYLAQHSQMPEVQNILQATRVLLNDNTLSPQALTQQFLEWMQQDKKITPLKTLQGLIWQDGYATGKLISHVYPDAMQQLRNWYERGLVLAIFSSGSLLAQKLLFAHTEQGDLTPLFSAYFDTTTGAKNSAGSYAVIAKHLNFSAAKILFLSDVEAELDAAQLAGMQTYGLVREPSVKIAKHAVVQSFHEIEL